MSIKKYMTIDIIILTGIACALEAANVWIVGIFKNELFTLSITVAVALIIMMRWKWPAVITAAAGGLVYCLSSFASFEQYLIYGAGNTAILLNLLFFKVINPREVCSSAWLSALFCITGFVSVLIGRTLFSLVAVFDFANIILLAASDALNIVMGLIIILIARRQKGLFENQLDYLKRNREETEMFYE